MPLYGMVQEDIGGCEGEQWLLAQKKNHKFLVVKHQKNTKNTKNYANIVQCHKETKLVIRCYVINFGILRPVEPESLAAPITSKTGLEGCRYLKIHPKHETGRVPETQA